MRRTIFSLFITVLCALISVPAVYAKENPGVLDHKANRYVELCFPKGLTPVVGTGYAILALKYPSMEAVSPHAPVVANVIRLTITGRSIGLGLEDSLSRGLPPSANDSHFQPGMTTFQRRLATGRSETYYHFRATDGRHVLFISLGSDFSVYQYHTTRNDGVALMGSVSAEITDSFVSIDDAINRFVGNVICR